jgi:hypothetical protein
MLKLTKDIIYRKKNRIKSRSRGFEVFYSLAELIKEIVEVIKYYLILIY